MLIRGRWILLLLASASLLEAAPFDFPTQNRALLTPGAEARFFVPTVGREWPSGSFGCVRSEGTQMHEGIDIAALRRDANGEPTDPVAATAAGTIAYVNSRSALSNYGKYVVIQHRIDGLEVYSLYAHLSEIRSGVRPGKTVVQGEVIGTIGRTANTRQRISKARAHVHFEINLLLNDNFPSWFNKTYPGQRNDHSRWNGLNLLGLDPTEILRASGAGSFNLLDHVRHQTPLCRVIVRETSFPWLRRYPLLVRRNAQAEREGAAAYELALNANGIPFELIPRAPSEVTGTARYVLLSVNEAEYERAPCRHLISRRQGRWQLTTQGRRLLDLLTF